MAGSYKVASQPIRARSYENKRGGDNLVVWRLGLEDAQSEAGDGLFELHMKKGNNPPGMGEQIEVDRFIQGEFQGEKFVRIKKAYSQDGRSGESYSGKDKGPGTSDGKFDRRPEHPRNETRMIHTSALHSATAYIEQMLTVGVVPQPATEDEYWALVTRVAGRLTRSYRSVLDASESRPKPASEVPADRDGLNPSQTEIPADMPFS